MILRLVVRWCAVGAVAVVATTLSGCSSSAPDLLQGPTAAPDQRGIDLSLPASIHTPVAISVGSYACSTRKVPVTAVTLISPSGLRLLNWGIDNGTGNTPEEGTARSLATLGNYNSHSITSPCGPKSKYSMVGIEVARTSTQPGSATGVEVHYRSGSTPKILTIWFGVALCGASPQSTDDLDPNDNSTRAQVTRMCAPNK